MKARLLPLKGKYYGTEIEITDNQDLGVLVMRYATPTAKLLQKMYFTTNPVTRAVLREIIGKRIDKRIDK